MIDHVQLSMYDDILIDIIRKAAPGVWAVANKEFDVPYEKLPTENPGKRHRRLSQAWVKYLAHALEAAFRKTMFNYNLFAFPPNPKMKNRPRLKRSEFLYDISLGNYHSFQSSQQKKTIWFQAQAIWQIESEFSNNMREIAIDFSKLLAGNATFQMMVGPGGDRDVIPYLTDIGQLAIHSVSELYFLFLSHPEKWDQNGRLIIQWQLYKWDRHEERWFFVESSKDEN